MSSPATHEITISPAYNHRGERLAGKFNSRFGQLVLVRASPTPLYAGASELLTRGLAQPVDTIVMKHVGSPHVILQSTVGAAAKQAKAAPEARASASAGTGSYPGSGRAPAHR
jgi:hypothetical protein